MAYSEFFVKAWFPEMYQFGQMLIAFLGASIWMSIFFVPLFHYLHVKNKVQYKKWIYSAFLIVIIALPLSFAFQNGKSVEDNLPSDSDNSFSFYAICFTGIKNMYLLVFISESSITTYPLFDTNKSVNTIESVKRHVHGESGTSLYEKVKVSVDKDNNLTFASGQNTSENQNFELVKKRETIFYESSNEFIKLNGKCVLYNDDVADAIAVAKFLKSQDMTN